MGGEGGGRSAEGGGGGGSMRVEEAVGAEEVGHALTTSKRLEISNQGQQGRPGGRSGDDVECGWAESGQAGR